MALCSSYWCCGILNDFTILRMNLFIYLLDLQCAMCRAVLESGADQKAAESLNDGIVYLMIIPYILGALTLYFLYMKFFKK